MYWDIEAYVWSCEVCHKVERRLLGALMDRHVVRQRHFVCRESVSAVRDIIHRTTCV